MATVKFPNFGTAVRALPSQAFKAHGTSGGSPLVKPVTVQPMKASAFAPKKSPLETAGQSFTARPATTPKLKPSLADAPIGRELPRNHVRLNTGESADRGVLYLTQTALEDFEHQPVILTDLHLAATKPDYVVFASTMRSLEPYKLFDRSGRLPGEVAASVRAIIKIDSGNNPRLIDPMQKRPGSARY